jgi:hypothetical protein
MTRVVDRHLRVRRRADVPKLVLPHAILLEMFVPKPDATDLDLWWADLPSEEEVFLATIKELVGNRPSTLTDLHAAEESVRQVYSDRFVFELLQNARDAAALVRGCRARVLLLLRDDALVVANDGAPFTRKGIEGIKGFGKSSKSGEAVEFGPETMRLIGRKGIGFKSVLQVSHRPAVFGRGVGGRRVALEFGSPRIASLCECIAKGDRGGLDALLSAEERAWLEGYLDGMELGRFSLPEGLRELGAIDASRLAKSLPVMRLPLWVEPENVPTDVSRLLGWDGGGADPYQTAIYLPLEPGLIESVRRRLEEDVVPEKILFLGTLRQIEVRDKTRSAAREIRAEWNEQETRVTLRSVLNGTMEPSRTWAVFTRDVTVPTAEDKTEERQVRAAVPTADGRLVPLTERAHLYTWYPLADEGRLFPFLVHAEFEPDPARTKLSPDHAALNEKLLDAIVTLVAGAEGTRSVLETVTSGELDARPHMPGFLIPAEGDRVAARRLREEIVACLRKERCVPTSTGWSLPSEVLDPGDRGSILAPFRRELAELGLHLPAAEWRIDRVSLSLLRAPSYDQTHLLRLLASRCTEQWPEDQAIGRFRQLFALMAATLKPFPWLLDLFRPGGAHATVPLLPCPSPAGGFTVLPLPARRRPGGMTAEEKKMLRVFRPPAELQEHVPPPPDDLRIRFLDERILADSKGLPGPPLDVSFAEDALDVRPYDTDAVIQALRDLDTRSLCDDAKRQLVRFVLASVVALPVENPDRRAFLGRARDRATPQPQRHAPPWDTSSDWRVRLEAFSRVWLPARSGSLRSPDGLRFSAVWHPCHAPLDTLRPTDTEPLADPVQLSEFLGAEHCARFLGSADRQLLVGSAEATDSEVALALAWGFARVAGVWETVPLVQVSLSVERLATQGPSGASYHSRLNADHLRFGPAGLKHRKAEIRTTRLRGLTEAVAEPARRRALADLLVRDWEPFFKLLLASDLRCERCRGEGTTAKHTTPQSVSGVPSLLRHELAEFAWYPETVDDAPIAPATGWVVSAEDMSESSAAKFLPRLFPPTDAERHMLLELGAPEFDKATPLQLLSIIELLASGGARSGFDGRLFQTLFHRIYVRLSRHFTEHPAEWGAPLVDRFARMKFLAIRDQHFEFAAPTEVLQDVGADAHARTMFRREVAFLVGDAADPQLFRRFGVRPFAVRYLVKWEPDPSVPDADADVREALAPWLPVLFLLSWRDTPGGGTPVNPDLELGQARLRRFFDADVLACRELAVTCHVVDRPDFPPKRVEAVGVSRAYLHEVAEAVDGGERQTHRCQLLVPVNWWKDGRFDPAHLPKLAPELARLFATPSHEDVFARVLALEPDEIDAFIEARGLGVEDLIDASQRLAHPGDARVRYAMAWRALLRAWPDSADREALERDLGEPVWEEIEAQADRSPWMRAAVDAAPRLLVRENLRRGGEGSVLAALQRAGFDVAEVSTSLSAAGIGVIRLRELPDLMRLWSTQWTSWAAAALLLRGATVDVARARAVEAYSSPDGLAFDALRTSAEMAAAVQERLLAAGLPGAPQPNLSREEQIAAFAACAGVERARLEEARAEVQDPEEHQRRVHEQFRTRQDAWLPLLLAIAVPAGGTRSALVRALAESCRAELARDFASTGNALVPFLGWVSRADGIPEQTARAVVDSLERGAGLADLAHILGRADFARDVERVRLFLDDTVHRRRERLRNDFHRHASLAPPAVVSPIPGGRPAAQPDLEVSSQRVRRGHATDRAGQRARERLGRDGEVVALAWVQGQLRKRALADPGGFAGVVARMRALLADLALDEELAIQLDAGADELVKPALDEEEFLDATSEFAHLSKASDGFGFDLVTVDDNGEPIALEVKTSRTPTESFHMSRWQRRVARELRNRYAILRVIIPVGGSPSLELLRDPVALEATGVLIVDPETFEMSRA